MATPSVLPPRQKQPSRKGKKAWRKNVDITEVQSGLEEVREQITKTGGVIAEAPDTQLFSLDLSGDIGQAKKHLGKTLRKLRADEILAERSAIPAVDSRKRPSGASVGDGVVKKAKHKQDWVSAKEVKRLRRLAFTTQDLARQRKEEELGRVTHDPWAMDTTEEEPKREFDFIDEKPPVRAPETLRMPAVSLAEVGDVPAVRRPEAGISYNPEFAKWDELLQREGEKEVEAEKKRLAEEAEARRIQELAAKEEGMVADNNDDENEDEDEEEKEEEEEDSASTSNDTEELKKKAEPKRKTQAQRNKEARRKAEERQLAHKKALEKQNRELLLIRKYARTIDARSRAKREQQAKSIDDDLENPKIMRRKRLGKVPLSKVPLELQLPDELSESLRRLRPEGNLVRDRFRSLQERGRVETRAPVVHARKVRRKATEKWSYKDFK